MVQDKVITIIKETLGFSSKKEAEEWQKQSDLVIDAVYGNLEEKETKTGDNAKIGKNLKIEKHYKKAHNVRNPKTGDVIVKPDTYEPKVMILTK